MPLVYIKNDTGEFVCPHCGVTKARQNTMYYHMKKHEGDLPHKCPECPMQFVQRQSLDLHILAKHAPPPSLASNNKPKTLREALQARDKAAASPTATIYKCPAESCEFTALSKGNCRIHYFRVHCAAESNSHFDKAAMSCTLCSSDFSSATLFYYHIGPCMISNTGFAIQKEIAAKLL